MSTTKHVFMILLISTTEEDVYVLYHIFCSTHVRDTNHVTGSTSCTYCTAYVADHEELSNGPLVQNSNWRQISRLGAYHLTS